MKLEEYLKKYDIGFTHDNYMDGEQNAETMTEVLAYFKENNIKCPEHLQGLIPVKIEIDEESAVEKIEETLWDHDFAGEDYEITDAGRNFLEECFEEYNKKYANNGNYCATVSVKVPEQLKYVLEVQGNET